MKRKSFLLMLLALLVVSCGKQIPSDIIQPNEMQNILYDYHIAGSLIAELPYSENYRKEAYNKYVFQKHNVTEELFDSSMVWYSRHTEVLSEMYKELNTRLEGEEEQMRNLIKSKEGQISVSLSGDSVDIWQDRKVLWLSNSELLNKLTFSLRTDTSFKNNDMFEFRAHFLLMPEKKDVHAVMALNIVHDMDSVQGITYDVSTSGKHSMFLKAESVKEFRVINGFIYFPVENMEGSSVLISDIELMRYHDKNIKPLLKVEDVPQRISKRKMR